MYTSVVREPLERMKSHYEYWYRNSGLDRFGVVIPFESSMSFETFALLPQLSNYQTRALGIDPSRFRLIGTTESLDAYMEELG